MQITPGKATITTGDSSNSPTSQAARVRAIAKLSGAAAPTGQQEQITPVQNPTQVQPEEMGAIIQKSQTNTTEAPSQVEVAAVEPVKPAVKEEPISSQFAQLARKEKAIRAKVQEIKAKESTFTQTQQENQALRAEVEQLKAFRNRVKSEPLQVMAEEGVTYDQLTEAAMNAPSAEQAQLINKIKYLEGKVTELEAKTDGTKKSLEDTEKARRQGAEKQIAIQVNSLIKNDPAYETIRETGQAKEVLKLIIKTFDKDGVLLTAEEAADQVEAFLVEEFERYAKINKLKQRLQGPVQKPQQQQQGTEQSQASTPVKTLTNANSTTRKLTPRERAILVMEGKLK